MRKTFIVILIVQFVLMSMFLAYALAQRKQANEQREIAVSEHDQAVKQTALAEGNEKRAQQMQMEAQRQMELARLHAEATQKVLEVCQNKK